MIYLNKGRGIHENQEPSPNHFLSGNCDESVIGIDHERPTAHVTYKGQPGDSVKILIFHNTPSQKVKEQSFELSSMQTEMQLPTSIPNADIAKIEVKATGRVGTPGECSIEVK